ncbi:MAG: hypothetical protein JWP94_740 [Mucilaginibacter sp.]|jgi:hypothetical protein|nr:hypothetical protein [Mucilaginibacter sp.]
MTAEEFKKQWDPGKFNRWADLEVTEIEKAPLSALTKDFLKAGFPEDAAPFLNFGWKSEKGRFYNIAELYPKYADINLTKNYWIIGSDGEGNPICFDVSQNDRVILLNHEQGFEIICVMNSNINELAACLLLYKYFIRKIQKENGEEAYSDANFSIVDLSELKDSFKQINNNIFKESGFWRSEINALEKEIG